MICLYLSGRISSDRRCCESMTELSDGHANVAWISRPPCLPLANGCSFWGSWADARLPSTRIGVPAILLANNSDGIVHATLIRNPPRISVV